MMAQLPCRGLRGGRIITTEWLAKLYGPDPKVIRKNFERNADRFTEGKHVFRLSGQAFADLRASLGRSHILPKARALFLPLRTAVLELQAQVEQPELEAEISIAVGG